MNTQKLAKALKKELTRNPKKTIALGLVTVVALWFWAPLALKWFGKGKPKARAAVVANYATPAAPAAAPGKAIETPSAATAKPDELKIVWNELLARMSRDERMQTALLKPDVRDPFAATEVESQLTQPEVVTSPGSPAPTVVRADPSPAEIGLILQGTLVSSKRPRAVIAGRVYGLGDKVSMKPAASTEPDAGVDASPSGGGSAPAIEFEVSSIEPTRVVLIRKNKEYELKLTREKLAEGDQLSFGSAR